MGIRIKWRILVIWFLLKTKGMLKKLINLNLEDHLCLDFKCEIIIIIIIRINNKIIETIILIYIKN